MTEWWLSLATMERVVLIFTMPVILVSVAILVAAISGLTWDHVRRRFTK